MNELDSINGILEIDNVEPFLDPLSEKLFNVLYMDRTLAFGGAILAGILLLWLIDRILTWAVNNSTKTNKHTKHIPLYLFPIFLSGAFVIDYLSVLFHIYSYPWISFIVFAIKAGVFVSTMVWAMKVFEVPVAKIFSFLISIVKAWKYKDVEGLDLKMNDLANTERKSGNTRKTLTILLIFVFMLSCLAPQRIALVGVYNKSDAESTNILVDTLKIVKYKNAFDASDLVKEADKARATKSAKRVITKRVKVDTTKLLKEEPEVTDELLMQSTIKKKDSVDIPVYFNGIRVGTYKKSNIK